MCGLRGSEVLKELLPKARFFSDVTPCQQGRYVPMLLRTAVCFRYIVINTLQKVTNNNNNNNNNNKSPLQPSYKLLAVQETLIPKCNNKLTYINRQGKNLLL